MLFTINNKQCLSLEQLRANTLLDAYHIIKNYPMHASDLIMDQHIQQQYGESLKNVCVDLLLSLTFHKDNEGNLILLFKDSKQDKIASLITYGNGAIPGSKILKMDTDINITSGGLYYIEFYVNVFQGSMLLDDILLTGINVHTFKQSSNGKTYRSIKEVDGNQRIDLFTGVAIGRAYSQTLNIDNFKMEVIVKITKA